MSAVNNPQVTGVMPWTLVSGGGQTTAGPLGIGTTAPASGVAVAGGISEALPARRADLVVVAPYDTPVSAGGAAYGRAAAGTREFLTVGHAYRVRQAGTISQVQFYLYDAGNLTSLHVAIWRKNGTTYDRVGICEIPVAGLTGSALNTVTLATPITGVQEGDFYGWRIVATGLANTMYARTGVSGVTTYYLNAEAPAAAAAFAGGTANAGYVVPILLYMAAPQIVTVGDSITAGHPGHYSFLEATDTTALTGHYTYWLGQMLGATYQNMGIGGETSTAIATRFAADVVALHPRVAVISAGTNDLYGGPSVTAAQALINWRTMLDLCRANAIVPVLVKETPWTEGSLSLTASSNGAVDGTTVVKDTLSATVNYYVGWALTVGSETRTVTAYNKDTKTLTVAPAFGAQVTTGTAFFLTVMPLRDARWESLATLARAYPDAVLVDLDYTLGVTNANANATTGNLWSGQVALYESSAHYNAAGYRVMGEAIAAAIRKVGKW